MARLGQRRVEVEDEVLPVDGLGVVDLVARHEVVAGEQRQRQVVGVERRAVGNVQDELGDVLPLVDGGLEGDARLGGAHDGGLVLVGVGPTGAVHNLHGVRGCCRGSEPHETAHEAEGNNVHKPAYARRCASHDFLVSNGIQEIRENGFGRENIPAMMAAVVVISIPLIILFLIFHKKIMSGVSRGGTKG